MWSRKIWILIYFNRFFCTNVSIALNLISSYFVRWCPNCSLWCRCSRSYSRFCNFLRNAQTATFGTWVFSSILAYSSGIFSPHDIYSCRQLYLLLLLNYSHGASNCFGRQSKIYYICSMPAHSVSIVASSAFYFLNGSMRPCERWCLPVSSFLRTLICLCCFPPLCTSHLQQKLLLICELTWMMAFCLFSVWGTRGCGNWLHGCIKHVSVNESEEFWYYKGLQG